MCVAGEIQITELDGSFKRYLIFKTRGVHEYLLEVDPALHHSDLRYGKALDSRFAKALYRIVGGPGIDQILTVADPLDEIVKNVGKRTFVFDHAPVYTCKVSFCRRNTSCEIRSHKPVKFTYKAVIVVKLDGAYLNGLRAERRTFAKTGAKLEIYENMMQSHSSFLLNNSRSRIRRVIT